MGLRSLTASLVFAFLLSLSQVAEAEELKGRYYGVDDATGASIEIKPDSRGYRGKFFDAQGRSQSFSADRSGDAAEAVLDMDGRTVLMRVAPLPYGAAVTIVPFDQSGNLVTDEGRILNFVRVGLALPEPGSDFVTPPRDGLGRISANGFLASYEFWDANGVRNGYLSLPDRFRTLIRLFSAVQLDVIWKLCLAPNADRALAVALRGQGVSCAEVVDTMATTQRDGRFAQFKAEVAKQKATLRMNVRCADGYPETKPNCDRAAKELSAQAVLLETAGTVLGRYR
ncbi:MAG: hypothetical protein OEN23_05005 [Paracoccaceae bacterium]|nr:hypothetical protein [Paracoccaceae bacterium]